MPLFIPCLQHARRHVDPRTVVGHEYNQSVFRYPFFAKGIENLADAALSRVKAQVSPKQYQIFHHYVVKQWDAKRVQQHLGVSMAQVYLAKHRVGAVLKRELARLQENAE